jgi:hypothetical protein
MFVGWTYGKEKAMDEQAENSTDRKLAGAGDQQALLRLEAAEWIRSKRISRCPACATENPWDLESVETVSPLNATGHSEISQSDPSNQRSGLRGRPAGEPVARLRWSLKRIRDAIQHNRRVSRLLKVTCSNCRYALLLDHVKMREEIEGH